MQEYAPGFYHTNAHHKHVKYGRLTPWNWLEAKKPRQSIALDQARDKDPNRQLKYEC
jgi:hypothetical protein